MYTRSYTDENRIIIPESYGGVAFGKEEAIHTDSETPGEDTEVFKPTEEKCDRCDIPADTDPKRADGIGAFLKKLPIGGIFTDIFKGGKFSLNNIGTEEILILATAAFLFFSKDGDRECAIMLLLLLFVS